MSWGELGIHMVYTDAIRSSKGGHNGVKTIPEPSFILKVAFFQKVGFVFQISKSPPKKYSEKLSWTGNLKFPPITVIWYGGNFEFQVQDSFLEIWKFEKWIALSEKKNTFKNTS